MTTRNAFEDIIVTELAKLLQRELSAGLAAAFSQRPSSAPAGALSVIIHNNAGALVSARETPGPLGQRQLEITIDQMVARALAGGRETSGVLRALFGLAPGLIGR